MKSLVLRILAVAAIPLAFSFTVFGQTRCERDYKTCVRTCNMTRDQTLTRNNLRRSQVRIRLGQDLTQCNVRFVGDPAGRQSCRNDANAAANAQFAELDRLDRQARRDRLSCISECRRRLRECQKAPRP
jgi:hypothetical protein